MQTVTLTGPAGEVTLAQTAPGAAVARGVMGGEYPYKAGDMPALRDAAVYVAAALYGDAGGGEALEPRCTPEQYEAVCRAMAALIGD